MATYKKPSVNAVITTMMEARFEGGAAEYEAFKAHKTISLKGDGEEVLIPFHAVAMVNASITEADASKADPYCE